ncbi:hypothetical protein GCM10022281_05010 [Sphingomonas rosea]|jgi:CRP-like cAMP-binding protein|uniref:HTH crp-type domain-containing protein n=1 Tax=Sphingomonas rosea TaxID=335605 RepID=A0ABP7TP36_9SPHN
MDVHLKRLTSRFEINAEEERVIRSLPDAVLECAADETIVLAGVAQSYSRILLSGVTGRHKGLKNGSRQITELNFAGDPIDVHSFTLKRLDHDIVSFSQCTFARIPHQKLWEMTERYPRLALIYWFGTNLDAAIHREWELSLGKRRAIVRMAHMYCELNARLQIVGLSDGRQFRLPLNQAELGECLGTTVVHTNRTLRQLRECGLCDHRGDIVTIHDLAKLSALAEFDPAYLYLEKQTI